MPSAIPTHSRWLALGGIAIASFLGCIDFTIVNTAIPAIQSELHASIEQTQWVVTMFVMALCSFMVAAGRLADLYGRRGALYAGILVFALASLGAGFSGCHQVPDHGQPARCRVHRQTTPGQIAGPGDTGVGKGLN